MKKGKIVVLTLSGLLVLSSAVIVPSVLKNKHLFNVAGEESSPCQLVFNKNSIIVDGEEDAEHYIQQGTLRLKIINVHVDKETKELTIYKGGSIETTGEAYDASNGYGSVANGISEIRIAPHDPSQKLNIFLAYTEPNDSYWRDLGPANSYVFQKGTQYPPRYFKFTADQEIQLDSFTISCTASEKLFPGEKPLLFEDRRYKNFDFVYGDKGEPITITSDSNPDSDLIIDAEKEEIKNYYRIESGKDPIKTKLKPYAYEGEEWLLVDSQEIDSDKITNIYKMSLDKDNYIHLHWEKDYTGQVYSYVLYEDPKPATPASEA